MNIKWTPDKNSDIPIYLQIVAHIQHMIKTGYFQTGISLSERALAKNYNVSRGTVAEAFRELKCAGILYTVPRSGTVVSQDVWNRFMPAQSPDWNKLAKLGMQKENRALLNEMYHKVSSPDIINLSALLFSETPFNPYDPLTKAIKEVVSYSGYPGALNNVDRLGFFALRKTLADHLKNYGINTKPDNIVVFNGYLEAINIIHYALLHPGVNYYAMSGDWIASMGNIYTLGVNYYPLAYDEEGPDPDDLSRKINRKGVNILYLNPVNHFPTGITLSHKRREKLLSISKKLQIPVIENDMMRDIWRKEPPPPLKASDEYDQIIYVGAFSNMCYANVNLAWGVVPDAVINRICDVRLQFCGGRNVLAELLGYIMLANGYYSENVRYIRSLLPSWLDKTENLLRQYMNGVAEWNSDNINYHIWLKFKDNIDTQKLFYDSGKYYFSPGAASAHARSSHIRLNSVCNSMDIFEKGLQTLSLMVGSKKY
ncbi:MAG: PLP-dependent aminotransferase family protein [Deferribacteraceae bacterium]|jgi:GntR family transcriptional regulator of abcA and norABC|nr:PLP-dependent aminotransferase family protein [Deferribacteraceae bacterium]